jgi:hypothetical protein
MCSFATNIKCRSAEETLEAKKLFEANARSYGVTIKHYHADNGRFVDNSWQGHIQVQAQMMSFSGVGAHHQTGIAEQQIRDLQILARSSLIHGISRWPNVIPTHLWPYALQKANNSISLSITDHRWLLRCN